MTTNSYCEELLSKYSSIIDMLITDIKELLKEASVNHQDAEICVNSIIEMLQNTGHVSRARSVAYMAAFCRYLARLVEAYGVSTAYSGIIPGKGTISHKLLAIASYIVFDYFPLKNAGTSLDAIVSRAINEAYDYLQDAGVHSSILPNSSLIRANDAMSEIHEKLIEKARNEYEQRIREAMKISHTLLLQLLRNIKSITNYLGLRIESLNPITEMQFVDYSFHIIGTPDLILEDEDIRRAIVVEWKTYASTPTDWEMAQAYVYALLEARRLGYGGARIDSITELREFIEAFGSTNARKLAVYPIVVRPSKRGPGIYTTHSALAIGAKKVADPCAVLHILSVASLHLTALLTNPTSEAREFCKVSSKSLNLKVSSDTVAVFRVTPPTLRNNYVRELAGFPKIYAGNPGEQKNWPCNYCKLVFQSVPPACRKYFVKSEFTPIEQKMFTLRNIILEEHENDMLIYKALYDIPLLMLKRAEERKALIKYDKSYSKLVGSRVVNAIEVAGSKYRFTFFDKIVVRDKPYYGDTIELFKYNMNNLLSTVYDEKLNESISRLSVIRLGKPVAIYIVSRKLNYVRPITLNIGLFARVEDIEPDYNKGVLRIALGLPSPALRFSVMQLWHILRKLGCKVEEESLTRKVICSREFMNSKGLDILAVEVSVDLTYMDLRILDLLYRNLIDTEDDSASEDIDDVERYADKLFDELYKGLADDINEGGEESDN